MMRIIFLLFNCFYLFVIIWYQSTRHRGKGLKTVCIAGLYNSEELKENLEAEKQIAAARADEVAMAAILVDPQILEEHLAIC